MTPNQVTTPRIALVVDDEATVRHYHSVILKRAGFLCEAAANGEEALQKIDHVAVDLAVIDMEIAGLDGLELVRNIREKPRFAKLPILVIADNPASSEILSLPGPVGHATKPLAPDKMLSEIRRLMGIV